MDLHSFTREMSLFDSSLHILTYSLSLQVT
jgi:hypothetical protein